MGLATTDDTYRFQTLASGLDRARRINEGPFTDCESQQRYVSLFTGTASNTMEYTIGKSAFVQEVLHQAFQH